MSQPSQQQQAIPIDKIPPQQLLMLKKNVEEEVMLLAQSANQFKVAQKKYEDNKEIIRSLEEPGSENKEVLIPITSSLYVNGVIEDNKNVIIDYGTGYFVERKIQQAESFCDRKIQMLKENCDKVTSVVNEKKKVLDQLNIEIQKRYQQIAAQQKAAAATNVVKK